MGEAATEAGVPKLSELTLSPGEISFDPDVTEYEVQVDSGVTRIAVQAAVGDNAASYTVSGYDGLEEGENEITVTVTGTDGSLNYYVIHVLVGEEETETETAYAEVTEQTAAAQQASGGISPGVRGALIFLAAAAAVAAVIAGYMAYLRKQRRLEQERRAKERERRRKRQELARRQEEKLLREIEMLTEKSRRMADTPSDGLRIIELDQDEKDEISRNVDEEMRSRQQEEAGGEQEGWPDVDDEIAELDSRKGAADNEAPRSGDTPDESGSAEDSGSDDYDYLDDDYDDGEDISDEELDSWLKQARDESPDDEEGEDEPDGSGPDGGEDGHKD